MKKSPIRLIDQAILSGWTANARRKSDARVAYKSAYPCNKTRWMGHGPSPGGKAHK